MKRVHSIHYLHTQRQMSLHELMAPWPAYLRQHKWPTSQLKTFPAAPVYQICVVHGFHGTTTRTSHDTMLLQTSITLQASRLIWLPSFCCREEGNEGAGKRWGFGFCDLRGESRVAELLMTRSAVTFSKVPWFSLLESVDLSGQSQSQSQGWRCLMILPWCRCTHLVTAMWVWSNEL